MRRCAAVLTAGLTTLCLALAALHAQQAPSPARPAFRADVDMVQVDVSVLDKNRKPVRGLTQADFTVFEDGKPRPVVAFAPVELPEREAPPPAAWMREVAPDVATNNTREDGRLVVIFMDRSIPAGEPTVAARRIATAAVDQLGPGDLAAVVTSSQFAGDGRQQNFTADRTRLLSSINSAFMGMVSTPEAGHALPSLPPGFPDLRVGDCVCGLCVLESLTQVADALREVPQRRKTLLFIGSSLTMQTPARPGVAFGCEGQLRDARERLFRSVDVATLTIHVLDPLGLETLTTPASGAPVAAPPMNLERQGALWVLPDRTGGRAVFNTNKPGDLMPAIFEESRSYYSLGFQRADPATDGRFHEIEVRVNRRGADVRARKGYYAPGGPAPRSASTSNEPPSPLDAAATGVLPGKGIPLTINVAPFAMIGRSEAAVLVTLDIPDASTPDEAKGPEQFEILTAAFDPKGRPQGSHRQTVEITWGPGTGGARSSEVLSRLDLKPGHYEIRVAAANIAARSGSVYTYVDVPNFADDPLSLSGVVLEQARATDSTPAGAIADLLPVVPTSQRSFTHADRVTAFVRAYQGGKDPVVRVQVTTQIVSTEGRAVEDESTVIAADRFGPARAADHRIELPIERLAAGEYVLILQATAGSRHTQRNIRFRVLGIP